MGIVSERNLRWRFGDVSEETNRFVDFTVSYDSGSLRHFGLFCHHLGHHTNDRFSASAGWFEKYFYVAVVALGLASYSYPDVHRFSSDNDFDEIAAK